MKSASCIVICFLFTVLNGCAAINKVMNQRIPDETLSESSAIAITVAISVRTGFLSKENFKPEKVYFAKLDSTTGSLESEQIFTSNYLHESIWGNLKKDTYSSFCMNLEPGIYAAIGAYGTGNSVGNPQNPTINKTPFLVYFPEEMVKESIAEVKSNTLVYMGKYFLKDGSYRDAMSSADKTQIYYYRNNLLGVRYGSALPGRIETINNTKTDEIDFLKSHMSTFKNTAWGAKLNNRLNSLN